MAYETLTLAQDGAVLTLTVSRPEVLNAQSRVQPVAKKDGPRV